MAWLVYPVRVSVEKVVVAVERNREKGQFKIVNFSMEEGTTLRLVRALWNNIGEVPVYPEYTYIHISTVQFSACTLMSKNVRAIFLTGCITARGMF
jgi:hypothetical protein